jgi:hypothetical protein
MVVTGVVFRSGAEEEHDMTGDSTKPGPPPRGLFAASLSLLVGGGAGGVFIVGRGGLMNIILGIILFVCGVFAGSLFLYAWFKIKRHGMGDPSVNGTAGGTRTGATMARLRESPAVAAWALILWLGMLSSAVRQVVERANFGTVVFCIVAVFMVMLFAWNTVRLLRRRKPDSVSRASGSVDVSSR